jgi:hypothetical protein
MGLSVDFLCVDIRSWVGKFYVTVLPLFQLLEYVRKLGKPSSYPAAADAQPVCWSTKVMPAICVKRLRCES